MTRAYSTIQSLPRQIRAWWSYERGMSSAAMFIIALPMILGAFGFGFDMLRVSYAKRYAQGKLDLAVQTAGGITYTNPQGLIRFGTSDATPNAWRDFSTGNTRGLYHWYETNTSRARDTSGRGTALLSCPMMELTNGGSSNPERCFGEATIVGNPPDNAFNFCNENRNTNEARDVYGVRYQIRETTPTVFLKLIGIPEFDYEIASEVLLRQQYC